MHCWFKVGFLGQNLEDFWLTGGEKDTFMRGEIKHQET